VDLEGEPFAQPASPEEETASTAWWVVVVPFVLAAAIAWMLIRLLRRRKRLPEIEGFQPPEIASDDERSSNSPRI
jgi:hypothetical protein